MARQLSVTTAGGRVVVTFTERADGDYRVDRDRVELEQLRRRLVDRPWTWLQQVHGAEVVEVARPGDGAGAEADAAVTASGNCPLAVTTADCAPVVLVAESGVAVIHAGWRGLAADVIGRAADRLRAIGGQPVASLIGPCISAGSYEFGAADLDEVAELLGSEVRSSTSWGTPALDVAAAVGASLRRAGWPEPVEPPACTSDPRWFSHRLRADSGRQATVAWFEPVGAGSGGDR